MATISLPADSTTLTLNGYAFTDLVSGDVLELAPENDLTSHVNSTNGGVSIFKRSDGGVHMLTVRTTALGDDDTWLNAEVNQDAPTVFNGSIKTNYVKDGSDAVESYILENGSIVTRPTRTINDQDGNALMEYVIKFRNVTRNL